MRVWRKKASMVKIGLIVVILVVLLLMAVMWALDWADKQEHAEND